MVLQGSFRSVSRKFKENFKGVSESFMGFQLRGVFQAVLRGFQGYLKEV